MLWGVGGRGQPGQASEPTLGLTLTAMKTRVGHDHKDLSGLLPRPHAQCTRQQPHTVFNLKHSFSISVAAHFQWWLLPCKKLTLWRTGEHRDPLYFMKRTDCSFPEGHSPCSSLAGTTLGYCAELPSLWLSAVGYMDDCRLSCILQSMPSINSDPLAKTIRHLIHLKPELSMNSAESVTFEEVFVYKWVPSVNTHLYEPCFPLSAVKRILEC